MSGRTGKRTRARAHNHDRTYEMPNQKYFTQEPNKHIILTEKERNNIEFPCCEPFSIGQFIAPFMKMQLHVFLLCAAACRHCLHCM